MAASIATSRGEAIFTLNNVAAVDIVVKDEQLTISRRQDQGQQKVAIARDSIVGIF
jgi:hypothetical protein